MAELNSLTTTVVFDESNPNWYGDPLGNYLFLKGVQTYLNNRLQVKGHVFLNEVFDDLAMPRTRDGALGGWVKGGDPDYINFIDGNPQEIEGGPISVTFTVQGTIYDKI